MWQRVYSLGPQALFEKTMIRPLNVQDLLPLSEFHFPWSTREETLKRWEGYLQEQREGVRLASIVEMGRQIAGYGSLILNSQYPLFKNRSIPEICDLWIFDNYRRKGLATSLIRHFEAVAEQKGYSTIGIGVGLYRDYGPAQQLYFQLGYRPDGEGTSYKYLPTTPEEHYPLDDDLLLWMTKKLSAENAICSTRL